MQTVTLGVIIGNRGFFPDHPCENGFEHHLAINLSQTAAAVNEALSKYMGWKVYYHK